MTNKVFALDAAVVGVGTSWGLFEAQWERFHHIEVELPDLDTRLDSLRILRLPDLYLGEPSLSGRALMKVADWGHRAEVPPLGREQASP